MGAHRRGERPEAAAVVAVQPVGALGGGGVADRPLQPLLQRNAPRGTAAHTHARTHARKQPSSPAGTTYGTATQSGGGGHARSGGCSRRWPGAAPRPCHLRKHTHTPCVSTEPTPHENAGEISATEISALISAAVRGSCLSHHPAPQRRQHRRRPRPAPPAAAAVASQHCVTRTDAT
jgi:hypothetical protein